MRREATTARPLGLADIELGVLGNSATRHEKPGAKKLSRQRTSQSAPERKNQHLNGRIAAGAFGELK
jgi:hypothetical protein